MKIFIVQFFSGHSALVVVNHMLSSV